MTNQQHPITPPYEQIEKWQYKFFETEPFLRLQDDKNLVVLLNQVYQAGADHELEACVKWIEDCGYHPSVPEDFRAARRPKPPSLKEQALNELDLIPTHDNESRTVGVDVSIIRRALEQLND